MLLESFYPVVGGMETQARNMARGFRAEGVAVIVVTRRTSRDLAPRETLEGVPVYRVPPAVRSSRARWLLVLTCLPTLIRRRRDYDIILVPGFRTLGISAVIAAKLLKKRAVLKAESSGEMSGAFFSGGLEGIGLTSSSGLVRGPLALRNRLLSQADALVSLSTEMTREFLEAGAPAERIHVIPQSADVERFQPASPGERAGLRAKLGLARDERIVTFTGRIVSYKGVPGLVEIWQDVLKEHRDARLLIVGGGGIDIYNCEEEMKQLVAARGLQGQVTFTGPVGNVDEYLRASDIYAFPTENEAFPLALLEAMACGLPAVATPVGGIPDVIAHEQNGLIVEPGNRQQLQAAIERLLADPPLRGSLGANARRTVEERYTRDLVTGKYIELFRQCLAR